MVLPGWGKTKERRKEKRKEKRRKKILAQRPELPNRPQNTLVVHLSFFAGVTGVQICGQCLGKVRCNNAGWTNTAPLFKKDFLTLKFTHRHTSFHRPGG
jgi:hypothetical protein